MNTLRNDLINKIKQMTEEWLLFINEAINSLSRSLIHDRNINACPYSDSRIVKNGTLYGRQRYCSICAIRSLRPWSIPKPRTQPVLSAVKECDETFVLENLKGTKIPAGYWRGTRKRGVWLFR